MKGEFKYVLDLLDGLVNLPDKELMQYKQQGEADEEQKQENEYEEMVESEEYVEDDDGNEQYEEEYNGEEMVEQQYEGNNTDNIDNNEEANE